MENLANRFRLVRMHVGLSQPAMSEKLGLSRNVWQTYELGKSVPGTVVYRGLIDMGFSVNWIMSGCGDMLLSEVSHDLSGYTFLPLYAVKGSMGSGCVPAEDIADWIAFKTDWLRLTFNGSLRSLSLIVGEGDSMMPTISPGDLVMVDTSKRFLSGDGIYVLNLFGNSLIKRVQVMFDGSVEIVSDNPAYKRQTIRGDELQALSVAGRVVWHGRRV